MENFRDIGVLSTDLFDMFSDARAYSRLACAVERWVGEMSRADVSGCSRLVARRGVAAASARTQRALHMSRVLIRR